MYDVDHKGYVSSDDVLDLLTMMIGGNVTSQQLLSIASRQVLIRIL
jgi:Ca2+-binding EF-hand superfamily protein